MTTRMVMRFVAIFVVLVSFAPGTAFADSWAQGETVGVVGHGQGSQQGATGGGAVVAYQDCVDEDLVLAGVMDGLTGWLTGADEATAETTSPVAYRTCTRVADGQLASWVTGLPAAAGDPVVPSAVELAALAQADLRLDLPAVATSPPRGGIQLVAIPVWFWVTNFDPATATASIPGLSATLTATPVTTTIVTGDGETLTCQGPGIAYDPTVSWRSQRSPCSHPYTDRGQRTVTATTTWSLAWTATNGEAGALPNAQRTSTFEFTIQEAQPVVH